MKILICFILALALVAINAPSTSAHILITDTTSTKGAILHINPDDDPVAGKTASLFFDLQGQDITAANLIIRDESSGKVVPLDIDGTLVAAEYVFPAQGVYEIEFTVQSADSIYTFVSSQRISRGLATGEVTVPNHAWAEILLLTSGLGLIVLIIVALNRREAIKLQSKW